MVKSLTKKYYGITEGWMDGRTDGMTDGMTDRCKPVYLHFFKAGKQLEYEMFLQEQRTHSDKGKWAILRGA